MIETQKLSDILANIDNLPWNHALFIEDHYPFNEDTKGLILDPDDSNNPDEDPEPAKQQGLKYAMGIQSAQGIVKNAKEQNPSISLAQIIDAFNFYYKNDAFMKL